MPDMLEDDPSVLAEHYRPMSDKELMRLGRDFNELTDVAQRALSAEFASRGLKLPTPKPVVMNFAKMSSRELLQAAQRYDQLRPDLQAAMRDEFASRGLEPPLIDDGEDDDPDPDAPQPDPGPHKTVVVGRYRDLSEAIVTRSVLEQAGIECYLRDENTVRIDWAWSNMIGGMRLEVSEEDAADAEALLNEPMPASFQVDNGPDFQQPSCPKCGSLDVAENNTGEKVRAASALLMPVALPVALVAPLVETLSRKNVLKCMNCGCKWYDDGEPTGNEAISPTPVPH